MSENKEKLLAEIRSWVEDIYPGSKHLIRTEYWLLKLNAKADLASRIAALTHDIERAFQEGRKPPKLEDEVDWSDSDYSQWHGERSADFTIRQLKKWDIRNQTLLNRITHLIKFHEEGGDKETDLIRDADSISFLEINAPRFVSRVPKELTKEEAKEKFDYMFRRISSPKVKRLARPFYKKAIRELERV